MIQFCRHFLFSFSIEIIAIVACISTVAIFSVIGAGYCFYKVQQSNKAAADVDFPAYGVIGPVSRSGGVGGGVIGGLPSSTTSTKSLSSCLPSTTED